MKNLEDEMREVLESIENDSQDDGPVLSEAEQLAAASPAPRQRVDGRLVGSKGKRPPKALTDSQQAFVNALIRGKGPRAAYRESYPNDSSSDQTISANAAALTKHSRIAKMLSDAAEETIDYMLDDADAGRRWVMKQLLLSATASKQEGSRLKALELVGRSLSMFQPQVVSAPEAVNAETLKRELDKHLVMLDDVSVKRKSTTVIDAGSGQALNEDGKGQPVDPTVPPSPLCDAT